MCEALSNDAYKPLWKLREKKKQMITYCEKQGRCQKLVDWVAYWKTKLFRVNKIEWANACLKKKKKWGLERSK